MMPPSSWRSAKRGRSADDRCPGHQHRRKRYFLARYTSLFPLRGLRFLLLNPSPVFHLSNFRRSCCQHKFLAERGGDGLAGFEEMFQMGFGSFLKSQEGFAAVVPMRVAPWKKP